MKKGLRKVLSIVLTLIIIIAGVPVGSFAEGTDDAPTLRTVSGGSSAESVGSEAADVPESSGVSLSVDDSVKDTASSIPPDAEYSDSSVIVKLRTSGKNLASFSGTDEDKLDFFRDCGVSVSESKTLMELPSQGSPNLKSYKPSAELLSLKLDVPGRQNVLDTIKALEALPEVEYAEPNYYKKLLKTPNDPLYTDSSNYLHNLKEISAPAAWDTTTGSSSIVVAVIDTGVDYNHPDLKDNLWTNPGEIPNNGKDDDNNGYVDDVHGWNFATGSPNFADLDGHGTHCAGTIGAVGNNGVGVTGVCWDVSVMGLCLMLPDGRLSTDAEIEAIAYAEKMGAHISSNSYGSYQYDRAEDDAIAAITHLFVAAAGNEGTNDDVTPIYPANLDYDHVVSVAATAPNGSLSVFNSDPYNYGASNYGRTTVDVAAPGSNIWSTYPTALTPSDNLPYAGMQGTSMATPCVAGAAALVLSKYPNLTPVELKNLFIASSDKISALSGKVVSNGRINVNAALSMAGTGEIPGDPDDPGENVFYGGDPVYKTGEVALSPYKVWYEDGYLYADMYITNGRTTDVFDIEVTNLKLSNSAGVLAEAPFQPLTGAVIEPNTYEVWTFRYSGSSIKQRNGDLTGSLDYSYTVTYYYETSASPFPDVRPNDWFYDEVLYVSENGLMNGSNGRFNPNGSMTRAMFVQVLANNTLNYNGQSGYSGFSDVPYGNWASGPVYWASTYGIVEGTSPTTFSPNRSVTRAQMVTMLYRYADACGISTSYSGTSHLNYPDWRSVPSYATTAFAWAINKGVINGSNGRLNPGGTARRAEVAAMFYQARNVISKSNVSGSPKPNQPGAQEYVEGVRKTFGQLKSLYGLATYLGTDDDGYGSYYDFYSFAGLPGAEYMFYIGTDPYDLVKDSQRPTNVYGRLDLLAPDLVGLRITDYNQYETYNYQGGMFYYSWSASTQLYSFTYKKNDYEYFISVRGQDERLPAGIIINVSYPPDGI